MPELPEVETVRIGLSRLLLGKVVSAVEFDWPKSFPNAPTDVAQFLVGAAVTRVKRRAKVLLVELNSNYTLVTHLKMTGQLVYRDRHQRFGAGHPSDTLVSTLPAKSTRVAVTFKDGSHLFFNDQRKFGWMRLIPTPEVMELDFFKTIGPEPLSTGFTWQQLRQRLYRRPRSAIKAVLLDQTIVAGIGNIYADEALWGAKIHPSQLVQELKDAQIRRLHKELIQVLNLAIEKGGSTDKNYINAEGKRGSYLSFARVFRREGLACSRCGTTITKLRVAGRGTHICPKCQKVKP